MAAVLTNFLDTFRDLGMTSALVRQPSLTDALVSTVFWLNCILGLILPLLIVALSVPAAWFFHEPALGAVLRVLALVFLLNSLAVVPTAILTREMAFRKINLASLAGAVMGTGVAIITALRQGGVWSLVFGTLTNTIVTTTALWISYPWRPQLILRWSEARSIASYTLNLSGFNILNYFARNADNIIVGRYLGSISLGYYQMAYTLMTYPLANFTYIICQVLFPAMAQVQSDNARLRSAYIRTSGLISLFTFPMMLGLTVTVEPFTAAVLGKRWLPVAGLLTVFAPLGLIQSLATAGIIYNAKGRTDWMFRWGIVTSLVYVASFFIGLRWGMMGVATSYAIAFTLLAGPTFAIPFRLIDLSLWEFIRSLWPTFKASLAMALIVAGWLAGLRRIGILNAPIQLASAVTIGALAYIVLLYLWKPPVLQALRAILENTANPLAARLASYVP